MNILFISQFNIHGDGWTEAAKDLARSLLTQDCNLVLRNINMANRPPEVPDADLAPYLKKKIPHYDVIIQKVLPNLVTYDSRFKQNILIPAFETELPSTHEWINRFKLVDKIFVFSKDEKRWLSNYHKKVFKIGEAIPTNIVDKSYPNIHPIFNDKTFKFYSINSLTERKNLDAIIKAYFRAFTSNDNVILVLKTGEITDHINRLRDSLRIYFNKTKYPPIMLINQHLPEEQINSIHHHSDCFVTSAYGEAFSRTAATALVHGNPVISTDHIGISDYLTNDMGWLIPSYKTYSNCTQPPLVDIYRGNETWYQIDEIKLVDAMKEAYTNKQLFLEKKNNILKSNISNEFSYETIGKNIIEALNE